MSVALDRWGFPLQYVAVAAPPPAPKRIQPSRATGRGCDLDAKILPKLREMCANQKTGERFTIREIASFCDCDKESIRLIQKNAVKKIRAKLGPDFTKQLGELINVHSRSVPNARA